MELFLKIKYSWYAFLNILFYIKKNTIKYYKSFFAMGSIDYFLYHIIHPDKQMVTLYKNLREIEKQKKETIERLLRVAAKGIKYERAGNT